MNEPSTERVQRFIEQHHLDAEIISTPDGVPTVELAASALQVEVDQIIKTLVFVDPAGRLVIAIACGIGRVDRAKLAAFANTGKLTFASTERVLETTGYPPGGVAPLDLPSDAVVVVDERVLRQPIVFGGSGTDLHMVRLHTEDIVRMNKAKIGDILQ